MLNYESVREAHRRIEGHVTRTPVWSSELLNEALGHHIDFKMDSLQPMGAFKIRGAANALLTLKEQDRLPDRVVALSSGNHAQAVAYVARKLGLPATIVMPENASALKRRLTQQYGATVQTTPNRDQAVALSEELRQVAGTHLVHPFNDETVMAGQGTSALEALEDLPEPPDAIFATCSGGGWLSGTYLAAEPRGIPVYGCEPALANDAAQSYRAGTIVRLPQPPTTLADAATVQEVGTLTFPFLQKLTGFFEVDEDEIAYWTQWLGVFLRSIVEPTSAVAMAGAVQWLRSQDRPTRLLVMISGGNVSTQTHQAVRARDWLSVWPSLLPMPKSAG
jgi:threo-3-hydroxy-L-aspartate ammonia-lyase